MQDDQRPADPLRATIPLAPLLIGTALIDEIAAILVQASPASSRPTRSRTQIKPSHWLAAWNLPSTGDQCSLCDPTPPLADRMGRKSLQVSRGRVPG